MTWKYFSLYQVINLLALFICALPKNKTKNDDHLMTLFLAHVFIFEIIISNIEIDYLKTNHNSFFVSSHGAIVFYYIFFRISKVTDSIFTIWFTISILAHVGKVNDSFIMNKTYLAGLGLIVVIILKHLYSQLFYSEYKPIFKKFKTILGIGIIIFFFCSFPLLAFYEKLLINNSAYMAYQRILDFGNIILSTSYLYVAIKLWKRQ